ncbi:hypothetical protein [Noviluteimonas gilva]|uniref:Uncharacterized protein n=1 Tax=Noviluteimonas gilva TaxID=2682097 RepID=A0A7C9LI94_9GAMM|nr:hypothetical protein [Lysobacter gilvus]MUV14720.1 hypothetical protein [Lysobacter gilvus]
MARPSPAALDVMEHIADAVDDLDVLLSHADRMSPAETARRISHARASLVRAQSVGAELLLEMLNLSERHELMQSEIEAIRESH